MNNSYKKQFYLGYRKCKDFDLGIYKKYLLNDTILTKYWDWSQNWGDAVNPFIISKLTGKEVLSSNVIFNFLKKKELLGIGSIISGNLSNKIIWGSGVISADTKISAGPLKVLALRGRLSLRKLADVGVNCEIFGDPVLLFPELYPQMQVQKKFKFGLVPHFKEKNSRLIENIIKLNDPSILILDPCSDIFKFVNDILSCENIISSSLHGLILAEAYGIPTLRYVDSDVILGGDFKYDDYYSGVGISKHDILKFNGAPKDFIDGFKMASQKDLKFNGSQLKASLLNHFA